MIGTDIVSVARIEAAIHRFGDRFLNRVFTEAEIRYCKSAKQSAQRFAGRFAAKEATIKALNLVGKGVSLTEIEVKKRHDGAVDISLPYKYQKESSICVSISHETEYAVAFVLLKS